MAIVQTLNRSIIVRAHRSGVENPSGRLGTGFSTLPIGSGSLEE